jgi:hypothetical protein
VKKENREKEKKKKQKSAGQHTPGPQGSVGVCFI